MTREVVITLFVVSFVSFLCGIGADAAATKIAAWRVLTRQRREARRRASEARVAGVMDLIANGKHIGQVTDVKIAWADSSGRELPMASVPPAPHLPVIDIPAGTPWSLVIHIMRTTMQDLKVEDRRRYFPGDHTARVN